MISTSPPVPRDQTDWLAIIVLFASGLAASMHFAKIAPVMGAIGEELQLDLVTTGFAVSLIGIVGVIFAIATGAVVGAAGLRRGILAALFGGAVIAAAGSMAPNGPAFLVSRFLEGFSHLLIVICAPALIALHAKPRDTPVALALWGCFFGLGFAITSVAAPHIVPVWGWRGLLMCHAIVLALTGAAVALVLQRSGFREGQKPLPNPRALLIAHLDVYRSGAPLLLALTFCCYAILFLAVLTFLFRYLTEIQHWNEDRTGSFMAFFSLVSLVFTLGAGVLVRLGITLFTGAATAFSVLAVSAVTIFAGQPADLYLIPLVLLMMASFGLLPGFVFASVPAVAATPALTALTYGAIAQFGNVGTFLGTPIFAAAYEAIGWPGGAILVAVASAAGVALTSLLRATINRGE